MAGTAGGVVNHNETKKKNVVEQNVGICVDRLFNTQRGHIVGFH